MTFSTIEAIDQKLMLAFEGFEPTPEILEALNSRNIGGFTLFHGLNVDSPAQVRALNAALQNAATKKQSLPLLIATDQEGGQLNALGESTTMFPGNMALGATGDRKLAYKVGYVIGREIAALGVNVNYAPVCDVNTNPYNPNVGVRAFGDDPTMVAQLSEAMVRGQQDAGIAATAKHFPGNGDSGVDPHFGIPVLRHDAGRLEAVEFLPFQAAIDAGVKLVMSAHVGLPSLTGREDLPATLSRKIMNDLLREKMGFEGLVISDALDMAAITQGAGQIVDVIAAVRAGLDLLLLTADKRSQERIYAGLQLAVSRGMISKGHLQRSSGRIKKLKSWLAAQTKPELDIVGCTEHQRLAEEVARRSVTLVRDRDKLLPLKLASDAKIAVVMPHPVDLTPADSSSFVKPTLAQAVRAYHNRVDEFLFQQAPSPDEIAGLREQLTSYDLLLVGTISAHLEPDQARLVNELLGLERPIVLIALRTPYDLFVFSHARTYICTYSIQPASMNALAGTLWGEIPFAGKLPVHLPGLYERGHGLYDVVNA